MKHKRYPQIRFKEFTDAWEQRKLGEISKIVMGQSPDGINYTNNPNDNILIQGNADLVNGKVVPRIWTTQITKTTKPNDIIFTVRAPVGEVAKNSYNAVIGRGVASLSGNDFLYQTLKKMKEFDYWIKISAGSTFDSINSEQLKNSEINIPSNEEQNKIGTFLEKVDNLIILHQNKYDKLLKIKKSLLEKMFPKNNEKIPEIRFKGFHNDWKQHKLDDFGKSTGGVSIESEFTNDGKYKVISIGSYSEMSTYNDQGIRCKLSNKTKDKVLNKDDITMILNDKTSSGNIIGRVLLIDKSEEYVYNQRTERIEINKKEYDPLFIYQLLNAPNIRKKIIIESQGNTQIYVNWTKIKELLYYVPDIKEQEKLGIYFKNIDNLIILHQNKLKKLKKLKETLLKKMYI